MIHYLSFGTSSLRPMSDIRPRVEQRTRRYIPKECVNGLFWLQLADVGVIRLLGLNLLYLECRACDQRLSFDNAREHIERLHNQFPTLGQWQQMKVLYSIGFKPECQWATEGQLSRLTVALPVIQRVQPSTFRSVQPLEAPDKIQFLKGPDWLWWAEVKVCLIQELQLACLYCERCQLKFPITSIREHMEKCHDVYEENSFWMVLRTQL